MIALPRIATRGKAMGSECENVRRSRCLVIEAQIQLPRTLAA
jgi:hypothetical protein